MQENQSGVVDTLSFVIGDLFREFGFWRTALAFVLAARERHRLAKINDVAALSSHLRRDIGLDRGLRHDAIREEERYRDGWR